MSTASFGGYEEHRFTRVVLGDVETVRRKLCDVVEDFNYIVLGDSPIQVKRLRTKSVLSATVLEYEGRLTIGLKAISEASTLVTFDYAVPYLYSKADKQALEREAEALIALATATSQTACAGCGAESTDAVRFCRSCGAPVARNKLPAELEVMRLAAVGSASQIELTFGLILCALTLLVSLSMIFFTGSTKGIVFGWSIFAVGQLLSSFFLIYGMRRLHRGLNTSSLAQAETPDKTKAFPMNERAALAPAPASIVEGTTELMTPQEAPVVASPARDTDSME